MIMCPCLGLAEMAISRKGRRECSARNAFSDWIVLEDSDGLLRGRNSVFGLSLNRLLQRFKIEQHGYN